MKYLEIWQGNYPRANLEKRVYTVEVNDRIPSKAIADIIQTVSVCVGADHLRWRVRQGNK